MKPSKKGRPKKSQPTIDAAKAESVAKEVAADLSPALEAKEVVTPQTHGRQSQVVDPTKPHTMTKTVQQENYRLAALKTELEANVAYCLAAKIDWLECEKELIAHLCGGKFPDAGYMIYKNVRLCLPGTSEDIARRERMPVWDILWKDGDSYRVGKARE